MRIVHLLLLIVFCVNGWAQGPHLYDRKENRMANSYFPLYNGKAIAVKNGKVVIDTTAAYQLPHSFNHSGHFNHYEVYNAVSDRETGALLFYSDGDKFINRNHEVMLNGDSIYGCISSNQGMAIVPFTNDKDKYYVFTNSTRYHEYKNKDYSYYFYSVVDMKLNNGLGGVVPGQKNIPLDSVGLPGRSEGVQVAESINVIAGTNCDYWVMFSHQKIKPGIFSADNFNAKYHITDNGISKPIIGDTADGYTILALDRRNPVYDVYLRLVLTSHKFFKFDYSSSKVTYIDGGAENNLLAGDFGLECVEFSKDGKCFYYTRMEDASKVYRKEISEVTDTEVKFSKLDSFTTTGVDFVCMKLINDTVFLVDDAGTGNLYYIKEHNGATSIEKYWAFANTERPTHPIVRMSDVLFPTTTIIAHKTIPAVCLGDSIAVNPGLDREQYDFWIWSNGDTSREIKASYKENKKVWLTYSRFNGNCREIYIDTFSLKDTVDLANPIIQVQDKYLLLDDIYESYQWFLDDELIEGANTFEYKPLENGVYKVVTTIGRCTLSSQPYPVTNVVSVEAIAVEQMTIYPNVVADQMINIKGNVKGMKYAIYDVSGKKMQSGKAESRLRLNFTAKGTYFMEISSPSATKFRARFVQL